MRRSKQYSIIDHEILHSGYFHRLSHEALVLYFFLVTVGDKNGKSYYSPARIIEILRLQSFKLSLLELINLQLIIYRHPNFWVNNFKSDLTIQSINYLPKDDKKSVKMHAAKKGDLNSTREIIRKLFLNEK
jgi:hypothetical protein